MLFLFVNPFALLKRLFIACFRVGGYMLIFLIQVVGYFYYRRKDKIIDAFGYCGRSVVDAISDIART